MKISEISSPDLHSPPPPPTTDILSHLESLISQTESISLSPSLSLPTSLPSLLRQTLTNLQRHLTTPLSNPLKLRLWKLSFRLWNSSVDIANSSSLANTPSFSARELHALLRHVAADILYFASPVEGIPSAEIKIVSFYYKAGTVFHELKRFDLAESCFERACDVVSRIEAGKIADSGERKMLLEVNLARSRMAFEQLDKNLALTLLNRARVFLLGDSEHYNMVAKQYLSFGRSVLVKNESSSFNEALRLMNEGLDLCEKGINVAKTKEIVVEMEELKSKALRFIAAVHLQRGEYESVIKCVKVLRDGVNGDDHPSLPVLAMKAWLGLGKHAEAEKELKGMVMNKGVPEGVWVSAVEAYFEASGVAGAETAKGVFLGLLGRCHVSAGAAVRVVHRVVGDGGCDEGRVRAKVVAELVADERVVALFGGETVQKERTAMHAILWNCASEQFRLKDYEMGAELFEKSLLYVPHDIQSRILRAKGYRVLCLCHLALSQLDRAQEYINEAEKLEPNIVCSFLKFKICLQKNDCTTAINQIQSMKTCLDFTPDFLSLAAHEAVACRALPVAVASLSDLLTFYTSGKPMPLTEVVVLRTLITILTQVPGHEMEALKFMKRAHSRSFEIGKERFFVKEEVGIREQKWFAVNSWNLGTKCGKDKEYKSCAEFLRLASDFYGGLTDGLVVEENSILVCESLILTVSAMLASENQTKTPLIDSEVKQAVELLEKAGKILALISAGTQLGDSKMPSVDPDIFFNYTFICYNIQGRLDNTGPQQQLLLVKNFAASKACNPRHLLQIGICASQGPRSNPQVTSFALNECLSALLSSPSPDYKDVALIIRRLIAAASIHKGDSDDDAVLIMYKQAYRIMVGLKEGEYPAEEGKWLATTAWNRAAVPVRLGEVDAAKKWMNVALELAGKVSGMETYKACMEDFVAGFDKKLQLQNNKNMIVRADQSGDSF